MRKTINDMMNYDETYKEQCRSMVFNGNEFLITEVGTSMKEKTKLRVNCDGFGRIRIFKRKKYQDWVANPLPFEPYSIAMGKNSVNELAVQVFQIAKCNLNCWWCFIPDEYKNCNINHTKWFAVNDLLELFIRDTMGTVNVIDISGGNPELVPEFTLQFMLGLEKYGLTEKIYLWSDDVLTTDFLFTKLSESQVQYMSKYKRYGKVACFKGIDDESFGHSVDDQFQIIVEVILVTHDIILGICLRKRSGSQSDQQQIFKCSSHIIYNLFQIYRTLVKNQAFRRKIIH